MNFTAYVRRGELWREPMSHLAYDASAGVLGTLTEHVESIGAADTREAITEIAYAQLGRDPTKAVYIANIERQVLEVLSAERYHRDLREQEQWQIFAWGLLFWCVLSLLATALVPLSGLAGLALFVFLALVYVGLRKLAGQNEGEAGCQTVLILCCACATLVFIQRAREGRKHPPQAPRPATRADESVMGQARQSQVERPSRPGKER